MLHAIELRQEKREISRRAPREQRHFLAQPHPAPFGTGMASDIGGNPLQIRQMRGGRRHEIHPRTTVRQADAKFAARGQRRYCPKDMREIGKHWPRTLSRSVRIMMQEIQVDNLAIGHALPSGYRRCLDFLKDPFKADLKGILPGNQRLSITNSLSRIFRI
jgi:hypothetical protein